MRAAPWLAACAALGACELEDARPPEWAFIAPVVLAPNCATASCHSRAAAVGGLDLSEPDRAYRGLTEQRAEFPAAGPSSDPGCRATETGMRCTSNRPLVSPCHPDQSRIVNMLHGRGAARMPPDRPLPLADVMLIERWILLGAKRRPGDPAPSCAVAPASGSDAATDAPAVEAGVPADAGADDAAAPADGAADALETGDGGTSTLDAVVMADASAGDGGTD